MTRVELSGRLQPRAHCAFQRGRIRPGQVVATGQQAGRNVGRGPLQPGRAGYSGGVRMGFLAGLVVE